MKRVHFIALTIFAISLLTTGVASNSTVADDDDDDDDDSTTTKPISSSVQLSSSMSESSTWTSSFQNTPSLSPSKAMEANTYTAGISASSSSSIFPTSSSSFSSTVSLLKLSNSSQSTSSSWYPNYYPSYNNYAYPNTYIKPISFSASTYGINPSKVMDSMMTDSVTNPTKEYENVGGPPKFPFPGSEGKFPLPGFLLGTANYQIPPNMPFPGFNGGFPPMQQPMFPIDPANYREPCEETLKDLSECCDMPKNIFKDEDLEKCKTSQPDVTSEICIKSCVLSNNNMYTPENKLNQMKVVEYLVSNINFDDTWKPIVKRVAYECTFAINGKFTAIVSGPMNCNMIADYLDSCIKSYFVKPCPQSKQPATLVATTCPKKLAIAARCDPFAMNEARKMSNIAVPQHNGPFPGMFMHPIMSVDNPNIAVMPPHFPMGPPMLGPNFGMSEPTRDCWKSLQMLPPNCCDRPILIPESDFKACENLPQGTTDDMADNPNWCQMECIFKNRNWLKDKVIDKEMVSTLVANVTDTTWQPVVKDAFFAKCFAKISEPTKAEYYKKCNPDPYNLMTCVDRELVMNCAKKSASEVSTTIYDRCKFSISQVENCELSATPNTPEGIPLAADANPNESNNASRVYPNKKKDETTRVIHHRVGGGSGIMGSLANGLAAGVGAGVANGVVNKIFNKGSNNGGGAPQYAMPGQGAYGIPGQGGYGMQNQGQYGMSGQGGYGMQNQGAYGMQNQGAYGMQNQGAYGMQNQGGYGQSGTVKQAVPMQNSQPGKGNNQKKSDKFAEVAKKVVQNNNQATNQKPASNTATNKKQVVPQKTSDSKKTQKKFQFQEE